MKKELNPVELDFLLRFPFKAGVLSPVDFLQHQGWGGIKVRGRPRATPGGPGVGPERWAACRFAGLCFPTRIPRPESLLSPRTSCTPQTEPPRAPGRAQGQCEGPGPSPGALRGPRCHGSKALRKEVPGVRLAHPRTCP